MKMNVSGLLLLLLLLFPGCAARQADYQVQDLHLVWQPASNGDPSRSTLTLTNTGRKPFPAAGWFIYLNGIDLRAPAQEKGRIIAGRVNGDLFRFSPGPAFGAIAPGASRNIGFITAGVKNISYLPTGFYLTWQNQPQKGLPLPHLEYKFPQKFSRAESALAAGIYRENQQIRDIPLVQLPKVFPTPLSYRETGLGFGLNDQVSIRADAAFEQEARLLAAELQPLLGQQLRVDPRATGRVIILRKEEGGNPESYRLQVTPHSILISATAPAGAYYGIQSLKSLLPVRAAGQRQQVTVPGVEVSDAPRFGHRAVLLDVARNFKSKAEVLKLLDVMALYKLNVLHLHFNDDEGWRLQIPDLPELTEVGARRGHTLDSKKHLPPSYGSGPDLDNTSGSGFYSRQDFIDILRYAQARHIRVLPEIETPGHARAAIKAMDARYERLMKAGQTQDARRYLLHDLQDKSKYRSVQGWDDNVMDVALPSTYAFLDKVISEMMKMYAEAGAPLQTIHLGGDEVPNGVWKGSPAVAALMKKQPAIRTVDDLWYYYFGKANEVLQAKGLYLSGWEEIGLRKVREKGKTRMVPNPDFAQKNFHTDVWLNSVGSGAEDLAYRLANAGYKVLLTNVTHFYFDLAYNQSFWEPGLTWGGFVDVDKPFSFIPLDYFKSLRVNEKGEAVDPAIFKGKERLTEAGKANIIGLQAPLWSEMIRTPERLEYMLLPKLLGLAERAWAREPAWAQQADPMQSKAYQQDWSAFVNVLGKRELPRLDHYAGGYRYRLPTAGAVVENGQVKANVQLPGLLIRYSTDGSEPTAQSPLYTQPIVEKGTISLRVFNQAGRGGRTVQIQNPG